MRSTARTGRIPSSEWPEIVARREKGETYAAIARDYGVTGPAIKYIVDKAQAGEMPAEEAAEEAVEAEAETGSADSAGTTAETPAPEETADRPAPRGRLGLGERSGRAAPEAGGEDPAGPGTGTASARDAGAGSEGAGSESEDEERPTPQAEIKRPASASDVESPLAQRVMETAADCAAMIERFESGDRGPAVDEGLKKSIHLLRRAIAAVEIERDRAAAPPPFRHQQSRPQAQSAQTGPSGKLPVPPPKPAAAPSESQLSGDTVEGTVKFFHADKGFGFVIPDDGGSDIFVPLRALKSSGLSSLQAEQRVRVSVVSGAKGPEANEVEPVAA